LPPSGCSRPSTRGACRGGAARLADYARASALAVQNAKLYAQAAAEGERARRRLAQLSLIHEVGREVARSLEVDAILVRMARGLHERLGFARVSVALVSGGRVRGHLTLVNGEIRWTGGATRIDFAVADHPDPFAQVARAGEGLIIGNAWEEPSLPTIVRETVRTIGYAPITSAPDGRGSPGEVLGVLAVDHGEAVREISEADLEVLVTLGAQVGVALQTAREFELLARREREARALAELGKTLAARVGEGDPAGAWLDALCDAAAAYAGAEFASIARLTTEPHLGDTAGSSERGRAEQRALPPGPTGLTEAALERGEPLLVPDATRDPRAADEAAIHGAVALLVLPLSAGGRNLGALILGRPAPWAREDAARLSPVGQQLALALENAELYRSLRAERARLAEALENLADGVLLLEDSRSGPSGWANAAARALLGLGDRFGARELPAQLRAALELGRATDADPDRRASLVVGEARLQVAVTRRGELTIVVLQDLARFRAVEQAKAELLSVVSHELRTPLTAIIGFVDLLLSGRAGPLSPDQTDFLVTTLDESRRLHQTVLNLLDASRLAAGLFELNAKAARLDFSELLERFSRAAAEKGVGFEVELEPAPRLVVDAARLELVLANLLSNALRYTPPGGSVTVRGGLEDGQLRFSVADTGPGMSRAELANLFRRFSRGAASRESLEGAGLSLYVSRAIVVAHGGRIWAESEPGAGTTMRVSLPAVLSPAERALA
jgi:signal transduction histidine kinase